MAFFLETLIGGLMSGMLYSLIALGFVLIFKASGVFNFAQGAMVLFAALAMARFSEWIPQGLGIESKVLGNLLAFAAAMLVMVIVAWLIEKLVLGKLVNQEGITLLMATLGITYFLDGFGQTLFGSQIYKIDVGLPKDPIFLLEGVFQGGILVSQEDLYAAVIAAALVAALSLFFQKTATGRALRAVADDHQAAQSIGIPLNRIWVIVWSVAGFVALVAGIIWGSKLGVQFSLSVLALLFLLVRPQGLSARRSSIASEPEGEQPCSIARTASSRPATAPTRRCSRSRRTASRSWRSSPPRSSSCPSSRRNTCSAPSSFPS